MDNKKLKSSWAAAFTVASVWFGTHVGAVRCCFPRTPAAALRPATRS